MGLPAEAAADAAKGQAVPGYAAELAGRGASGAEAAHQLSVEWGDENQHVIAKSGLQGLLGVWVFWMGLSLRRSRWVFLVS